MLPHLPPPAPRAPADVMCRSGPRATWNAFVLFALALAPAMLVGATGAAAQEPDPGARPAEI
jgi:hypothetical protein